MNNAGKLTVALTLDFDAHSGLADAGYQGPADFSRGLYGATVGVKRIINIFQDCNLPLTCFIPGIVAEKFSDCCKLLRDAGFEIGHHGYNHQSPMNLEEIEQRRQIERGLAALDDILNVRPLGYRAPWLQPSIYTYSCLSEFDFLYDASECGADSPYFMPQVAELIEIPGKFHLIDTPLFNNFAVDHYPPAPVCVDTIATIWQDEFIAMYEADEELVFVHTIHPHCIGHHSRINMYNKFIQYMLQFDNVEFCSMTEIASRFRNKS